VFGTPDLHGRTVLVQGAGAVGADLVTLLQADGADVLVSDVDDARAAATGATVVPPDDVYDTECDIYSPCAVGGTLNATTIPRLRCRIVGGSANNQLAEPEDARRLHERGILYAPDFIINAGGVIQLVGLEDRGWDEEELQRNLRAVGDTLREIFARGGDPAEAAEELAAERIAAARR
jgi:leucine dehydrogenase